MKRFGRMLMLAFSLAAILGHAGQGLAQPGSGGATGPVALNWQTPGTQPLNAVNGVSTTVDNQILVELLPDDLTESNPFDLNGLTLVFTPDGRGGYTRDVRSLAWEEDIGSAVADGAVIALENFGFDFAGQRWDAFHVSRRGLVTFGGPLAYAHEPFHTIRNIARKFVSAPTISPLYKPMLGGRSDRYGATQHVARWPDRVVVTWVTTEPNFYVHGVPPENPARFQAVLGADGSIRFNYADVAFGDGIVGLFPYGEISRGDLVARAVDGTNPGLSGHLDLLDLAIYESTATGVIFEITTRERHRAGQFYRLHFDADEPYWSHDHDRDFSWGIDVEADRNFIWSSGPTAPTLLALDGNRLTLLADVGEGLSASVTAGIGRIDGEWKHSDTSPAAEVRLAPRLQTDLSRPESGGSVLHSEVFHYPSIPELTEITCRVIDGLGDAFDLFVFHSEFRVDSQDGGTPWTNYGGSTGVAGLGKVFRQDVPCGEGRLLGRWILPIWMKSDLWNDTSARHHDERTGFDRALLLFAHEFTHVWTAHASFINSDGVREPLYDNGCRCHWRWDLHQPAAFPWHAEEPGPRSLMGQNGTYWRDNGDGTFTPLDGYWGGGHSWLDLYMMGLADAHEVPDTFILRNLRQVGRNRWKGDPEMISINQIVAAEGPREPRAAHSQKVFNAAFVYLLEPGQAPSGDLLDLHRRYRDQVQEHWRRITGGRSQITTSVHDTPGSDQRVE